MKGSEFVFDSVDLLYYKFHRTSLNRGGSYIESPKCLKNKEDWNDFEKNNEAIALSILYVLYNTKEIRREYKSKHNLKHKNQVILLMVTDGKKWHYLVVKKCLHCLEEKYLIIMETFTV